jgi:hypothetical protein
VHVGIARGLYRDLNLKQIVDNGIFIPRLIPESGCQGSHIFGRYLVIELTKKFDILMLLLVVFWLEPSGDYVVLNT